MYFTGIGTVANTLAVFVGGVAGLLLKRGLKEDFRQSMMKVLGLAVIFLGMAGALTGLLQINDDGSIQTKGTMLMIISLTLGMIAGELLHIEDHMDSLGEKIKKALGAQEDKKFVEGFVTNALVICVGAMAVVGSLQDGLAKDPSMLYAKAILDAMITMVFAASMGIGAIAAAIPLAVYQGSITLLAGFIEPYLTEAVISDLSYIGSILITATGINLLFGKTIKVGNMLPALIMVLIFRTWLT